jgi:hypothetical protein
MAKRKSSKVWMIYISGQPAEGYEGPYTRYSDARETLKWMKHNLYTSGPQFYIVSRKAAKQNSGGISLASLGRGIKAKWVKIRKVGNGIRVTIKK